MLIWYVLVRSRGSRRRLLIAPPKIDVSSNMIMRVGTCAVTPREACTHLCCGPSMHAYMHLAWTAQRSAPPTSRHLSGTCLKLTFAPSAGCSPDASWATQVPHQDASYMLLPAATCFVCARLAEQLAWGLTGAGRVTLSEETASRCLRSTQSRRAASRYGRGDRLHKGCESADATRAGHTTCTPTLATCTTKAANCTAANTHSKFAHELQVVPR